MLLEIRLDGQYSQHLALTRGESVAAYPIMLGAVIAGRASPCRSRATRARSSAGAGRVDVRQDRRQECQPSTRRRWLSRAPILRARPGHGREVQRLPARHVRRAHVNGESGSRYQLQYTVIFTNEDGGTPTDRLMATWGRTTDIEFIYGLTEPEAGAPARAEIQAAGHKWIPFQGPMRPARTRCCGSRPRTTWSPTTVPRS